MNAPHHPAGSANHMVERAIEYLPVGALAPSDTAMQRLRRPRIAVESALAELAESIRADGIHQPLLVRRLLRDAKILASESVFATHELVFGERRWRAAQMAGLEHVPCIVRELSDAEVLRAQLAENIHHESSTPLEEAEGFRALLALPRPDGGKLDAETLGAQVGRSRSSVYDCLKLLDLSPEARAALADGRLDMYRALVVARVRGEKLQKKALAHALKPGMSVRALKSHLTGGEFTIHLASAPFALDDATLHPEAGACATCPSRAENCGEYDPDEDDPNVCTDVACFKLKVHHHDDRAMQRARESGRAILTGAAAHKIIPRRGVMVDYVDLDVVCDEDEFTEAEPRDGDSPEWADWDERKCAWQPRTYRALMQAVLKPGESLEAEHIEDPHTKRLREIVPVARARRLLKRAGIALPTHIGEAPADEPPPPARPKTDLRATSLEELEKQDKERERHLREQEERAEAEKAFRNALLKAIWNKATGALKREDLLAALELVDGTAIYAAGTACLGEPGTDATVERLQRLKDAELARFLRVALVAECVNFPETHPGALLELATRHRIDHARLRKDLKKPATPERKAKAATKKPAGKKPASRKLKRK